MSASNWKKPDWIQYCLGLAFVVSLRSPDQSTKHGCVITDNNNRIIATGYNGYLAGINDDLVPKTRPDKYELTLHSELNALLNSPIDVSGGTAYVTGKCCNHCFQSLIQAKIKTIYMASGRGSVLLNTETDKWFDFILEQKKGNLDVHFVTPDLSWIIEGLTWIHSNSK
jgi:deoxycytidylate deaminase